LVNPIRLLTRFIEHPEDENEMISAKFLKNVNKVELKK